MVRFVPRAVICVCLSLVGRVLSSRRCRLYTEVVRRVPLFASGPGRFIVVILYRHRQHAAAYYVNEALLLVHCAVCTFLIEVASEG